MDLIFEIVGEVLIEGAFEIASNKKVSKWIRYPILILIISFYSFIVGTFVYLGLSFFNENILISIIMFLIAIFLIIMIIIVFIKNKKTFELTQMFFFA